MKRSLLTAVESGIWESVVESITTSDLAELRGQYTGEGRAHLTVSNRCLRHAGNKQVDVVQAETDKFPMFSTTYTYILFSCVPAIYKMHKSTFDLDETQRMSNVSVELFSHQILRRILTTFD